MTQEKLGEIIGVATSNGSHIERATTQVSLSSLVKIANALDTTLEQLTCGQTFIPQPISTLSRI